MKTHFFVLVLFLSPLFPGAQPGILPSPKATVGFPTTLEAALGKGDVTAISTYLADKVTLVIGAETQSLSKSDAATELREFYTAHPAEAFYSEHFIMDEDVVDSLKMEMPEDKMQSADKDGNWSGKLITEKGAFKVSVVFVEGNPDKKVKELRFEHQNM